MLYVHIPYCHQKCTYCAFYSTPSRSGRDYYVEALCRELVMRRGEIPHPLRTLYFGGGTPSLLTLSQLATIFRTISSNYDLSALQEVTLEANPEDLTEPFLQGLADMHFVNRLSVGVQSFFDSSLALLNRRHTGRQAFDAVAKASSLGFDNISIDLIYGLPNQSMGQWLSNLDQVEALGSAVTHLSCYALTLEEGTMLHRQLLQGRIQLPEESEVLDQYQALQQWCRTHGWSHYEVSSYCREGRRSIHNSRYWNRTPYLGVGAAAHSFDGASRRWNISDAGRYAAAVFAGSPFYESETLTEADALNEYVMTGLRTFDGLDLAYLQSHWPLYAPSVLQGAEKFIRESLLVRRDDSLCPTDEGILHADGMASDLFVE